MIEEKDIIGVDTTLPTKKAEQAAEVKNRYFIDIGVQGFGILHNSNGGRPLCLEVAPHAC